MSIDRHKIPGHVWTDRHKNPGHLGHRDTENADKKMGERRRRKKKSRNIMSPTFIGLGDIKYIYYLVLLLLTVN